MTTYIYEEGLESVRLITRRLTEKDIPAWTEFYGDKEATEFQSSYGMTSEAARSKHWIEKQLTRYQERRYGLQALIEKRTNSFIGQCGLLTQEVDGKIELEVGYHIIKKYWGQGFAPEAARLFIDYAFEKLLAPSVISIIDRKNIKSQRVADKNGLKREKETNWTEHEVYIYRIYQTDWNKMSVGF